MFTLGLDVSSGDNLNEMPASIFSEKIKTPLYILLILFLACCMLSLLVIKLYLTWPRWNEQGLSKSNNLGPVVQANDVVS